jgi:hypothetical protein
MLFKRIFLAVIFMFMSTYVLASPDQQERSARCQLEATFTQAGFESRFKYDKEEFEKKLQEFVDAASKDPAVTKEQIEMALRTLRQGFHGMSPQKAYNACMTQKQV